LMGNFKAWMMFSRDGRDKMFSAKSCLNKITLATDSISFKHFFVIFFFYKNDKQHEFCHLVSAFSKTSVATNDS